ncbi:glycosyltransferase family 2 protein [Pedobacter sp. 22163]|uniref:glycosyltransferase family 2 protein n=1 Tax=Pedobacter sp. 22163 TaxID=3453883 RepID=UPI003F859E86
MVLAIHTVFILRENILFLEEWIKYHLCLGFNHIYLYDNSGSLEYEYNFNGNNRYNIDFKALTAAVTDEQLYHSLNDILRRFSDRLTIIDWSPKNAQGEIVYGQKDSIVDYFKRYSKLSDWTAFIDIDEFIFCTTSFRKFLAKQSKSDTGSIVMKQKKFRDRFDSSNKRVIEIFDCIDGLDTSGWAMKVIVRNIYFDENSLVDWGIHFIPVKNSTILLADFDKLRFNHYNVNEKQLEWMEGFFGIKISINSKCYQLYNASRRIKPIK